MPSPRRSKLAFLAVFAIVTILLYLKFNPFAGGESPYLRTLKTLKAKEQALADQEKADMAAGLKEAEDAAKEAAQRKAGPKPDLPGVVEGTRQDIVGGEVGGERVEVVLGDEESNHKADHVGDEIPMTGWDAREEIAKILKKRTIVIFSKTYCPYSKKAKEILLDKYKITPPPYVVELDEHPRGKELQEALAKVTGRNTVPNILIAGTPIGGGDDIVELDRKNELADVIYKYGKKRIINIFRLKEE